MLDLKFYLISDPKYFNKLYNLNNKSIKPTLTVKT